MTDTTHLDRLKSALADRYVIERELGAGGMATVYLAHDVRHDRKVAVKVLKPELAAMIGGERFLTEIKTTANLQHPHILPLFDSGSAESFLYYVMPYIEGESLRGRLNRERQLGVEESLRITRDVADALDYAHRQGVIHRDIKPENILLHDGRPVVADFGIALAISAAGGGRMTETGLSLGTPHYMSPEQATADRDLSPRSDIYSLACVLYEMLSGDPPHTGPTAQAILVRILTENPRSVSEARTAVPPHVTAVLAKALEKLPADRFESAKAFGEALEDQGFIYTARTPGRGTASITAPPRRAPASRAPLMAVGAVAILALGLAAWGWMRPEPEIEAPVARLDLALGEVVPLSFADVVISPDGSMLAVSGRVNGEVVISIRRIGESNFQVVPGTRDGVYPDFSPDGEWLVFRNRADGYLARVPVAGGGVLTLVDDESGTRAFSPHWGEDGTIVFTSPGGLQRIPALGSPPESLDSTLGGNYPHILPDGSGVLATRGFGGGSAIYYYDIAADSSWEIIPEGQHPTYIETGHILYVPPGGGLFAVPFDLGSHAVTGPPTRVLDRVAATGGRRGYSVSRHGTLVHLEGEIGGGGGGGASTRFLIVDRAGATDTVRLPGGRKIRPRFSPDGGAIAYERQDASRNGATDIYTFDLVTGTNTQITFEGDNDRPLWSPDGTNLAFNSTREGTQDEDLFSKPADNSTPEEAILTRGGNQYPDAWLADGRVVFTDDGAGNDDLYVLDPSGGGDPVPYLRAPWNEIDARVSPDGSLAAHTSSETGAPEIWLRDFPDPTGKWRVSFGGGRGARWAPDGRTLYYWRWNPEPGADTLFSVRIDRTPGVVVRESVPVGVFNLNFWTDWDLHPDGERFLITELENTAGPDPSQQASASTRLFVVLNWFTELKATLGKDR